MGKNVLYDVCITGGGLAGLSTSILLARKGYTVILLEKEAYPFHRVCGEYISMESEPFLSTIGIDIEKLNCPRIRSLQVSSPNGALLSAELDMGGFGISRFLLDELLSKKAVEEGVTLVQKTKVKNIYFKDEQFYTEIAGETMRSKVAIAAIGKRSNLDIKWKRAFISKQRRALNNYIGIKYHIKSRLPEEVISLHNFKNGYCGISKIENDIYCLCYLTTSENLKKSNNSIELMEKNILSLNKRLKDVFEKSEKLFTSPVTISQISFEKKELVYDHILTAGDAAGMISPLCGNGMSMALHTSVLLTDAVSEYLGNTISRTEMELKYEKTWRRAFDKRLKTGRVIQSLFGKPFITNIFIFILKKLPMLVRKIIRETHGVTFGVTS